MRAWSEHAASTSAGVLPTAPNSNRLWRGAGLAIPSRGGGVGAVQHLWRVPADQCRAGSALGCARRAAARHPMAPACNLHRRAGACLVPVQPSFCWGSQG